MARVRVGTAEIDLRLLTGRFSKSAKGATRTTNLLRGAFVALGSAASIHAAKRVFELGAAVEETGSKFRTVFGAMSDDVQMFVDDFAHMAGLTAREAQDVLATTGAIAQGMGLAGEASAEFSKEVVRLAGDLSSFNNIPIAETSLAIQAAITGEREQLKRLGIVVREVDVQRRSFANTGKTVAKELTNEEKAIASLQLIAERAGVAVGDLARTQDSAANVARRLGARFREMREDLAVALLPAFTAILDEIDRTDFFFTLFIENLKESGPKVAAWTKFAIEAFKQVAETMKVLASGILTLGTAIVESLAMAAARATNNFVAYGASMFRLAGQFDEFVGRLEDFAAQSLDLEAAWEAAAAAFETGGDNMVKRLNDIMRSAAGAAAEVDKLVQSIQALNAVSRLLSFIPGAGGVASAVGFAGGLLGASRDVGDIARGIFSGPGPLDLQGMSITPPNLAGTGSGMTLTLNVTDLSGRTTRVLRERIQDLDNRDVPVRL